MKHLGCTDIIRLILWLSKKLKKKATKVFKLYGIEIEKILEDVHSEYPFFSTSNYNLYNLRMKIQQLYSDKFTGGNLKKGHHELERRLEGTKESKKIPVAEQIKYH